MIAVALDIFKTSRSNSSCVRVFPTAKKNAHGIVKPNPAVRSNPLPTSLTTPSNSCLSRMRPPTKKHSPRQSNKFAKMEPRIADLMTEIRFWDSKTMKSTISTILPRKVSRRTPARCQRCLIPTTPKVTLLTNHFGQFPCQFLTRKSDKIGSWDHGDVVEGEDPVVGIRPSKVDRYRCGNKRP